MTIDALISNTQNLNLERVIEESMHKTSKALVDYQKDQMLHGLTSKGTKIGKYKSEKYAAKKYEMNQLAGMGNMDFRLTGDFFRDTFADVRDHSVVIDSGNEKTQKLLDIAPDLFGLTDPNASKYSLEVLRPDAVGRIKSIILK